MNSIPKNTKITTAIGMPLRAATKRHFHGAFVSPIAPLAGSIASLITAATLTGVFSPHAEAASVTWTGGSGADWNTGTNWSTNPNKPLPADTAVFNSALTSVAVGTSATITGISFDSSAGTAGGTFTLGTLGGGTISGSNGGTTQMLATIAGTGKTITVNAPFVIIPATTTTAGGYTFSNNSGETTNTLVLAGPITSATTSNTTTLTLSGSNTGVNTVSGAITTGSAGTFVVFKAGLGTWALTSSGSWNGTTNVAGGSLQFSGAGANAGNGAYSLYQGALTIDNTGAGNNNYNRIGDASAFSLYTGSLIYKGSDQAGTNSTETIGTLTQNTSGGAITISYGGSNLATLTATSFGHTSSNPTTLVNGANLGKNNTDTGSVGKLILTTAPTLVGSSTASATGIAVGTANTKIDPYLVGESSSSTGLGTATGTANTFVTYIAGSGVRPLSTNPADGEFSYHTISTGNNTYIDQATAGATSATVNSLVINGGNLSIADGQTLANTSGAILFASSHGILPSGSTGALTFGSGVEAMITVDPGVTGTIGANITASGNNVITIGGAGTLVLAGSNSQTGNTYFGTTGATLVLGSKYAFGSGTAIMTVNLGAQPVATTQVSSLQAGTDLSGANAITNPVILNVGNGGAMAVTGSNNLTLAGPVTDTAYNLPIQNLLTNGAVLTIGGTLSVPGGRQLAISGSGNTTISGNIASGHNGGTFTSTGLTTLSGTNLGTVGFTLSSGTLAIGNRYALGTTAAINWTLSGGTLTAAVDLSAGLPGGFILNGSPTFSGTNNLTVSGTVSSNNNRTITNNIGGGASLTLAGAVVSSTTATNYTLTLAGGGYTVVSGSITNGLSTASNLTVTSTGTVALNGQSAYAGAFSETGAGTVNLSGTMNGPSGITISSSGAVFNETSTGSILSGSFTLTSGTANLNVANTFSGPVTLTGGVAALGNKGALGSGTIAWNGSSLAALTPLTGANAVSNLFMVGGNGTITGTNNVELSGTVINNQSNYTLTNNIGQGNTFTLSGAVALSESGTARTLALGGSGYTVVSGSITNGPSAGSNLTITSTGTVALNGQSVYTGTFGQTGAGTVNLSGTMNGPTGITINNSGAVFTESASGSIVSGSFILTAGTANLNAANGIGPVTLTGGVAALGNNGALGSGAIAWNGSSLAALTPLTGANAVPNLLTISGTVAITGTNSVELNGTVQTGTSRTLNNNLGGGATLNVSGPLVLNTTGAGNFTLTVGGSGAGVFSGVVSNGIASGTGGITYAGTGSLQLTNPANAFTGVIKASSGKLTLAPTGAALTSTNQFQSVVGSTLEFAGDAGNSNVLADAAGLTSTSNLGVDLFTSGTWTTNAGRNIKADWIINGGNVIVPASAARLGFTGTGAAGSISFNMVNGSLTLMPGTTYGLRLNCDSGGSGPSLAFSGTQSGGVISVSSNGGPLNSFELGGSSAVISSWTMTGGTTNVLGTGANGFLDLGADTAGSGTTTFTLAGGRLWVSGTVQGLQSGANQIFNFTGGTLAAKTINATNLRAPGDASNGTFTENGAGAVLDVTGTSTTVTGNFALQSGLVQIGANRSLTVSGSATINDTVQIGASGTLALNGGLNGAASGVISGLSSGTGTLYVNPGTSGAYQGVIQDGSGQIQLVVSGSSTLLALTGSCSYTGSTTVSGGILQLGDGTAGHDAVLATSGIANSSQVRFNYYANQTIGSLFNGNGTIWQQGPGTLTLTGSNSAGLVSILSGTLQVGDGTIGHDGPLVATSITAAGTLLYDVYGSGTCGAAISNAGSLIKAGPGTLTLTGSNSYTGSTTITGGTLQLNDSSINTTSGVLNNGVFAVNANTSAQTCSIAISGSGAFVVGGTKTVTLTGSNSYTGSTTINSGTLQIGDGTTLGSINSTSGIANSGVLAYNFGAGSQASASNIGGSGSLVVTGSGGLTLIGSNSYTGNTTLTGGTLQISDASNIAGSGTLVLHGGVLQVASATPLTLANNVLLNVNGSTIASSQNLTLSGTFTNSGANNGLNYSMGASGTLTLSGPVNLSESSSNARVLVFGNNTGYLTITGQVQDYSGGVGTAASGIQVNSGVFTLTNNSNNFSGGIYMFGAGSKLILGGSSVAGAGLIHGNYYTLQATTPVVLANNFQEDTGHYVTVSGSNSISIGSFTNSAGSGSINNTLTGGAALTISGTTFLQETTGNTAGRTLTVSGGANTTFNGPIVNGGNTGLLAGSFTITSTGTTTLNGANTYTGVTTGSAGTVVLGSGAAFGTSSLSLSGATIQASTDLSGTNALTTTSVVLSATNTTVSGANSITIGGNSSGFIGADTTLTNNLASGKTLTFTGDLVLKAFSASRWLYIAGSGNTTFSGALGDNSTAGTSRIAVNSTGTTTVSGNITYNGNTWMNAATGTLILSGSNSGAGGATLTAGTLVINNNYALGAVSGTLTIAAGSIDSTVSGIGNASANPIAINGNFAFGGTNDLNLGSGPVTGSLARVITLNGTGKTLTLGGVWGNSNDGSNTITVTGAGNTLSLGGIALENSGTTARTQTIAGSGNVTITGAVTNGSSTGATQGLTVANTGTVTLSGLSSYNGAFQQTGAGTVSLTGTINGPTSVTVNNTAAVFNEGSGGAIQAGSVSLIKGLAVLSGSNSYGGGTTVSSGTLQVGNANALGTGNLTVNSGKLDLAGNSVSVAALSGSGGIVTNMASGTGTLITSVASGTSTYAGSIVNGTGAVALTNSGAGTLILSGSLAMAGLNANSGITQLTQSDSIGAVSVASGATVSVAAHSGSNYRVLNISSLTMTGFTSGLAPTNSAAPSTAAPALLNADNVTGASTSMLAAAGQTAVGSAPAAEQVSPEAVPEPGSLGLLLTGALGMLGFRRRKAKVTQASRL